MTHRKKIFITAVMVLLTLANSTFLGLEAIRYQKYKKAPAQVVLDTKAVEQKIPIKNAKLVEKTSAEQGKKLGEGDYKFETATKSKIETGDPAELVVAANEETGGHFVLAFLGGKANFPTDKVNQGWTLTSIASDAMWAPGACSSKPTFLLKGQYIFIDDGKTKATDKYNSYIVFNMKTGQYNYFGGDNFTAGQSDTENILSIVNENDKLVFYIDPEDTTSPQKTQYGQFIHTKGNDHSYVIRREIDPATMHYTDYSLPFVAPSGITNYQINAYSQFDSVVALYNYLGDSPNGSADSFYTGKVQNNSLALTLHQVQDTYNQTNAQVTYDTPLELTLYDKLKAQLPAFGGQTPYPSSVYKTDLSITELGSHDNLQFVTVRQRYGSFDTPAIINVDTKDVKTLINQAVISQPENYVELGVF